MGGLEGQVAHSSRRGQNPHRAKSPLWEGWEGPGFLSAADRAKSPLWEGGARLSAADRAKSHPTGQIAFCGRAERKRPGFPADTPRIGQNRLREVSYPPRIGQNRLCGLGGNLSAADMAKSPLWGGGARFPAAHKAKSPLWGVERGQVWFPIAADRAKSPLWEGWEGPGFLSAADRAGRAGPICRE